MFILFNHYNFKFQEECRDIIDKYIEYDPVVISLDILLLNRKALRHVLFNSHIKVQYIVIDNTLDILCKIHYSMCRIIDLGIYFYCITVFYFSYIYTQGYWKYVILLLVCDSFVKMTLQRAKGEITPVNPTYIIYSAMEWGLYKNFLLAAVGMNYFFSSQNAVACYDA